MAQIILHNLSDTNRLGHMLAEAVATCGIAALLLRGPLGSGKTTLTRALVEAMPGRRSGRGGQPFVHALQLLPYPTLPVIHSDLYRSPGSLPDEIAEGLDNPQILSVLEWSEYLPEAEMPQDYLDISVQPCEESRLLTLQAHGPIATELLRHLRRNWPVDSPDHG